MKLVTERIFNLDLGNDDNEVIISKSKDVFTKIDPNFEKWNLHETETKDPKKSLQKLTFTHFRVEDSKGSQDEMALPYLFVKAYPAESKYYLFSQENIVTFCKKCRDLLVGEHKKTLFYCRNHYEIFIVEVRSKYNNNNAELEVRPLRLGDSGILTIPTGGLQIFIINDALFTDGTKSSDVDIWKSK